jgi:hypothetical protein
MLAASSTAESRVGRTPRCARARAPSAAARGKGGRQRYWNGRQNCCEHQGNDLIKRQLESVGIPNQQHDDAAIEHSEISRHTQNGLLLGAFDVRSANKFRSASKFCTLSSRLNLRNGFAAPYQRSCISLRSRPGFDGY